MERQLERERESGENDTNDSVGSRLGACEGERRSGS